MVIKFNIAATFIVAYMQALEIFPTVIRQSGVGLCSCISQMISIAGPYVIFLGSTNLMYPYMVMALICLVGSVATSFLPETIGSKLPETIEEADRFGKHDTYFSYKPRRYEAPMEQEKGEAP
jgi:OCT family organic cation transporter-like MFS transporter 4/5